MFEYVGSQGAFYVRATIKGYDNGAYYVAMFDSKYGEYHGWIDARQFKRNYKRVG